MIKKSRTKEYIISSIITFLTGFISGLLLTIDKFDLVSIESGAWIGLILVALRMGVKAVLENVLHKYFKVKYGLYHPRTTN